MRHTMNVMKIIFNIIMVTHKITIHSIRHIRINLLCSEDLNTSLKTIEIK